MYPMEVVDSFTLYGRPARATPARNPHAQGLLVLA